MIEILHEMVRYDVHINEIFCCDCYFDEIYFFLRIKKNFDFLEKKFEKKKNCYFDISFNSLIIVCYDFVRFFIKKIYPFKNIVCQNNLIKRYSFVLNLCY